MPRVCVLTGCASGIGRQLSSDLLARGYFVLATDVNEQALRSQARERGWEGRRIQTRRLDVRDKDDWEGALAFAESTWGQIDIVMNIAGVLKPGYVHQIQTDEVDFHLDVNTKGTILGTRAAAARMVPRRSGHIINFGSLASLAPVPGLALYAASKFAVRGFSLSSAFELKKHGVSVTLLMPDAVQTPMLDLQLHHEEAALTFSGSDALSVQDIARAVIEKVIPDKPIELAIPFSRGALARLSTAAPELSSALLPRLLQKGRRKQSALKAKTSRSK